MDQQAESPPRSGSATQHASICRPECIGLIKLTWRSSQGVEVCEKGRSTSSHGYLPSVLAKSAAAVNVCKAPGACLSCPEKVDEVGARQQEELPVKGSLQHCHSCKRFASISSLLSRLACMATARGHNRMALSACSRCSACMKPDSGLHSQMHNGLPAHGAADSTCQRRGSGGKCCSIAVGPVEGLCQLGSHGLPSPMPPVGLNHGIPRHKAPGLLASPVLLLVFGGGDLSLMGNQASACTGRSSQGAGHAQAARLGQQVCMQQAGWPRFTVSPAGLNPVYLL